jgi:hypothetical protein
MQKTTTEGKNFQKIHKILEKVNNESQKKGVFSGFHSA